MSDLQTLLTRCRELGAEFIPTAEGKLKVKAPAPLPEELREALKQRKTELIALLKQPPTWPCPGCGSKVRLEPPQAEELPTRLWASPHCSAWGATRAGATAPVVWLSTGTMQ